MPQRMSQPEPAPPPESEVISDAAFARLMTPFAPDGQGRVAVAVSGGADSLALAMLLAAWGRAHGVEVHALTVDHGLRKNSTAEARLVGGWLADLGVEQHILPWRNGPETRTGIQAAARDARYALMADWCRDHGVGQLFVAHHLGDQAETFVMRLKRASTLFGLAAMAAKRQIGDVTVCRPLLGVTKASLQATLRAKGLGWVEDPSNTNPAFERARTRALIDALSDEGVTPARLAGAANAAARLTDILDRAADAFEATAVRGRLGAGVTIERAAFVALPLALRERVLSRLLVRVGGGIYPPNPLKTARFAAWMTADGATLGARTLGGCVARRGEKAFQISPEGPRGGRQRVKKAGFFAIAPLPRAAKGLTSQATDRATDRARSGACACTRC